MFKKEKGITLIALVITIIVLLILAGVSITAAINGNGLFNRSKKAANVWKNSTAEEDSRINGYSGSMDNAAKEYANISDFGSGMD